jgi:mono/diheme cytochrome c family protein
MRRLIGSIVAGIWLLALGVAIEGQGQNPDEGWKVPATAAAEKPPFPVNDATLAAGKKVFTSKCERCHGPKGEGDGVDADIDLTKRMDLTRADRATANPAGVVFYKVWHGKQDPRMPAFEDQLTREQAWAAVLYAQTLRKK